MLTTLLNRLTSAWQKRESPALRWALCMGGLAVTAAAGLGLVAILSIVNHGFDVLFSGEGPGQTVAIIYFLASVPMVPALIALRRRYRRLSQAIQWTLAGVAIASTALAFAMLIGG